MMKNTYEIYPKTLVGQNVVFQNMSNHYRRIYNAKPRIDSRLWKNTRLPTCNETKRSKSGMRINNKSPSKLEDAGQTPTFYRQCCAEKNLSFLKHDGSANYQPRILKTNVESKVRNLKVYHPPRRRLPSPVKNQMKTQMLPEPENEMENEEVEEHWITRENGKKHPSKPCSSDSAYTEEGEVGWSGGESRGLTPVEANSLPSSPVLEWASSQRTYRSDDALYVRFLREITEDVLRKGVFTNRALKQIFQDHIKANKYKLDIIRMQEEIEKLRIELGVPKEDYLNDLDFGLGSETSVETSTNLSENDNFSNKELLEALNQLDISDELKDDVANSLGLKPSCSSGVSNRHYSENVSEESSDNCLHISRKDLHIHLPSSDDEISDGYEELNECSKSSRNVSNIGDRLIFS